MFSSPFQNKSEVLVPPDADIVFVSDLFSSDHLGGAELTTDAIIDSSPYNVFRLHSKDVNEKTLQQGLSKFWIFGNFSGMNLELLPAVIANMKYSIVEYDYKYCKYRSPEKHAEIESKECDCNSDIHGKMISAFYFGAKSLWWMSEKQMNLYHVMFPFLSQRKNTVLSSVFDESFFKLTSELANKSDASKREKWIVVNSTSWIKGTQAAIDHCKETNLDYEVVGGLSYHDLLEKLSKSKGLVFLPLGNDTCPRLVIEAKMLGCDLILNENVQHASEDWFSSDDNKKFLDHLYNARERFWTGIKETIEHKPTLSGYTTTMNCVEQNYPFEASISSLLNFCDQVVVVDGGSTDKTWKILKKMAKKNDKLIIHQNNRDWSDKRFAVFDGLQKSLARALCTGEFCWQQDVDEIVHESDYEKVKSLANQLPNNVDLVALPILEFWGNSGKVRIDVNPWKWRLSRNRPYITHGIPANLRKFDDDGRLYSLPGTDGCDYVRADTYEPIPFMNFYTEDVHSLREKALSDCDEESITNYGTWLSSVFDALPGVYHYSWFDIERKIRTYRDYWSKHWQSLYDIEQEDTPDNNMFFNKSWENVSEDEITDLSKRLSSEMGGWIFHQKIDFSKKTPHISLSSSHPKEIKKWIKK
jgi:glycosyltransferase involved in cell wall biosynthesis